MSSEEKKKILKMVEDGKVSAEAAVKLMKALDESVEDEAVVLQSAPASERMEAPEFDEVARRARRLWQIPLWLGVATIILSGYWLYSLVRASDFGFLFYCAWLPFLLGVLLLALTAGSRTSRWLFVNVDRTQATDWPRRITLGLPLPFGLAAWFLRNFGQYIHELDRTSIDEIVEVLSQRNTFQEPLIVNVNEGEHGERVQVYIG
jgi:hypothetical protein